MFECFRSLKSRRFVDIQIKGVGGSKIMKMYCNVVLEFYFEGNCELQRVLRLEECVIFNIIQMFLKRSFIVGSMW